MRFSGTRGKCLVISDTSDCALNFYYLVCVGSFTEAVKEMGTLVFYFWTVLFLFFGLARILIHEMYIRRAYLATSQFLLRFTVNLKY
jgi:hypothetical protein